MRNLPRELTEKDIFKLFQPFGEILSVNLVLDGATGRSKGFGFVEMPEYFQAVAAINALNGRLIGGEKIRVKTTNQPDRSRPKLFGDKAEKSGGKEINSRKGKTHGVQSKQPSSRGRREKH